MGARAAPSPKHRSSSEVVIFDFDLTLVDTKPVETLRAARNWNAVMARASGLQVYNGIHELLADLDAKQQTLAIVTKSPDMVPRHFVERHRWPIHIVLGYHQVRRRKPDPEGLLLAMQRAGAGLRERSTWATNPRTPKLPAPPG